MAINRIKLLVILKLNLHRYKAKSKSTTSWGILSLLLWILLTTKRNISTRLGQPQLYPTTNYNPRLISLIISRIKGTTKSKLRRIKFSRCQWSSRWISQFIILKLSVPKTKPQALMLRTFSSSNCKNSKPTFLTEDKLIRTKVSLAIWIQATITMAHNITNIKARCKPLKLGTILKRRQWPNSTTRVRLVKVTVDRLSKTQWVCLANLKRTLRATSLELQKRKMLSSWLKCSNRTRMQFLRRARSMNPRSGQ